MDDAPGTPPGARASPKRPKVEGWENLERIWRNNAKSMARLIHLKKLNNLKIGHNREEDFVKKTKVHRKSSKKLGFLEQEIISMSNEIKIKDEQENLRLIKKSMAEERLEIASARPRDANGSGAMVEYPSAISTTEDAIVEAAKFSLRAIYYRD